MYFDISSMFHDGYLIQLCLIKRCPKNTIMSTTIKFPTPPWDMDIAADRLKFAESAWNSHDIGQITEGYADNIEMRDGLVFVNGKDQLAEFLKNKLKTQLGYRLKLDLWGALKGRMAVRFEAEWNNEAGESFKSYGVQVFQFNDAGLVERRFTSQESLRIPAAY